MNIALWFAVGGLLGWLMSRVLSEPGHEGTAINLTVGPVSATLAGWFLAPWLRAGGTVSDRFDFGGLVLATVGALVALTAFNLLRQSLLRHR
ncbi:GlsB/YeaQ/YmgE family stress response membrane protein [Ideonella sp. BN130291]|uniref:GlsB/YeaQ/YmgE family stress response membrane protein n=1 Tax=Ideonella sp. BN130291 TaxID=3112940 RepID=UPI002E253A45|nr:GlsB/YeaQ/YmgE family stress response membrane protein [Ideonella sp. BN130291]